MWIYLSSGFGKPKYTEVCAIILPNQLFINIISSLQWAKSCSKIGFNWVQKIIMVPWFKKCYFISRELGMASWYLNQLNLRINHTPRRINQFLHIKYFLRVKLIIHLISNYHFNLRTVLKAELLYPIISKDPFEWAGND